MTEVCGVVADMAAATPESRDRFVDFLRVASLLGVIAGHFLMAVVTVTRGAEVPVSFTNIMSVEPWTRWGTWILQVMPVFFVVGGFAHATAWRSLQRKGGGYADFVRARISRLVAPALVFIGVGVTVSVIIELAGADTPAVAATLQIAGQLLWFIGIYLIAAALAPVMLRLHERFGWRALAVLVALVVAVDVARLALDVPHVMWLNFAFVWLAVHQLGFFYADGLADRIGGRRLGLVLLGAGLGAAIVLIWLGPYGAAMVSYPGEKLSNLAPPTVVLLAFGVAQAGALLLVRDRVTRWLHRPAAWKAVIAGGAVSMTAYLWHFTALILMYAGLYALGAPVFPDGGTGAWWAWRLPLFVLFLVLVAGLVLAFRWADRPARRAPLVGPSRPRAALAAVGAMCAIVGMVGFAVVGFRGVLEGFVAKAAGVPMSVVAATVLVVASAVLTSLAVRRGGTGVN